MRRYSCSERHPGLCFTADAIVYHDTLRFATNVERWSGDRAGDRSNALQSSSGLNKASRNHEY
jgi:hypothetical protein